MTLDQKIQVWNTVGTWLAAIGTLAAVAVALYLSTKSQRIKLKVLVGTRVIIHGDRSPRVNVLMISATNLAERPVTVNTIGWRVGWKHNYKYCVMPTFDRGSPQCPIELAHGKTANFLVTLVAQIDWCAEFASGFLGDVSDEYLKTLRAQIFTSVGQSVTVLPEESLIKAIKEAGQRKIAA